MIEPLRVTVTVDGVPDHAFRLWTERMAVWWPTSHSMSRDPQVMIVVEPHAGGRIFERASNGHETDWGSVVAWDPPQAVRYRWFLGGVEELATDVSVVFTALSDDRTRVDLEQTGWERLGEAAEDRRNRNEKGWAAVLPGFVEACGRGRR